MTATMSPEAGPEALDLFAEAHLGCFIGGALALVAGWAGGHRRG
ncbi:MAG: hypothetical protein ACI9U2_001948 [Bradymonadia bacterium]|jgi:hypothetical protein